MKTYIKWGLVFLFFIISAIIAVNILQSVTLEFVKSEISQQFYRLTGHTLMIRGDVRWSLLPPLKINIQDVVIDNKNVQTSLIKAGEVGVEIKLIPLFSKKFEVNAVNIKQGQLFLKDEQAKILELNDVTLNTKNISLNKPFAFNLSGEFKKQPNFIAGNFLLNGTMVVSPEKNRIDFSNLIFDSRFKNTQNKQSTFSGSCNLIYNEKSTEFFITKLTAKLNGYNFNGNLSGIFSPAFSAHGDIQSNALSIGTFLFKNVRTLVDIKNEIISLNSLTANLYEGNYTGNILVDTRPTLPIVTLNALLKGADASMLFSGVMQKDTRPFTGTVDVAAGLKFILGDKKTIRKTLNGNASFLLQNGILHGVNLFSIIELGQTIIQPQTLSSAAFKTQTDFGTLKATFQIQNGVMFNQDLTLQSSQLFVTGRGKIDLVNEQMDYRLNASLASRKFIAPILIQGSFDRPVVALDAQQILKKISNEKVDQFLTAVVGGSGQEDQKNQLKQKLGEELKKLNLGSLIG